LELDIYMFGFLKSDKADDPSHWYALVPGFNTSTGEFYAAIETELKERQVPGLESLRVEFAEGGLLSDKREYLRMTRERLVFDICAAPFGTAYFFSCRFAAIPAVIKLWQLFVVLIGFCFVVGVAWRVCGLWLGSLVLLAGLSLLLYVLRNAVAMGLKDLDTMLVQSPVVGPIYELFFRKDTYYRIDTRIMYADTVNAVVKAQVEEVTGAKGIKLIRFNECSPFLGELYKSTIVELPRQSAPTS